MSSIPVVAAYGGVWQAGVTRDIDAISICIEFSRTASAAGVGDVTFQYRHYTIRRCGTVKHQL